MKLKVSKVDVWHAEVADQPGELSRKLGALAEADANLGFVIARRTPEHPGRGFVWVAGLKGAKQFRAAEAAGFTKTEDLFSVRIEGRDRPGLAAKVTAALGKAGINVRGLSAASIGKRGVAYIAVDTAEDAKNAARTIKKL